MVEKRVSSFLFIMVFMLLGTSSKARPKEVGDSVKEAPGHTIWVVWLQGLSQAPYVVKECITSWKHHNPTWNVQLLSMDNVKEYVSLPPRLWDLHEKGKISNTHMSDILRIHLLFHHGGVWADATLLCLRPLDDATRILDVSRPTRTMHLVHCVDPRVGTHHGVAWGRDEVLEGPFRNVHVFLVGQDWPATPSFKKGFRVTLSLIAKIILPT